MERLKKWAIKLELKSGQDKIAKLQTRGLSYFLANFFFGDDGFQNMFIYQLLFSM